MTRREQDAYVHIDDTSRGGHARRPHHPLAHRDPLGSPGARPPRRPARRGAPAPPLVRHLGRPGGRRGVAAAPPYRAVAHAPTPTDEPLGVPALIASLPLDTARRHPAPGPLTDFLVQRAADAYAELLGGWEPVSTGTVDLVPGPLGKGELDGALRAAVVERLPRVAFLAPAAPSEEFTALRPFEAEVVEGAAADTVRVMAEVLPTLLPAGLERRPELRTLGVGRLPLGDAIDRLAGAEREPSWWRRLYESLAGVDPDRLSGLPVPLAGGRTVIGPRQSCCRSPGTDTGADTAAPEQLTRLGLKVAHPDAEELAETVLALMRRRRPAARRRAVARRARPDRRGRRAPRRR